MIFLDLGRLGKARITRPTVLEVAALMVILVFLGALFSLLR